MAAGRRLHFQNLVQTSLQENSQHHRPRSVLVKPSGKKSVKQAILRPTDYPIKKKEDDQPVLRSIDCCLQTPVANFKHCGSDAMRFVGCCMGCLLQCTQFVVLPILSQNLLAQRFGIAATGGQYALMSLDVGFVGVQPGFLQLLLTQTCIRSKAIRATSKNQSRMNGEKSGLTVFTFPLQILYSFLWVIGL